MFGKNLKRLMIERDLNGKRLSELSGVSQSGISQYLKGTNIPSSSIIEKLAGALHVDPERLTEEKTEERKEQNAGADADFTKMQNVPVALTAKLIGKSDEFIRIGLQQNRLPFGTAVKISGDRWTYHISPGLLQQYLGKAV